MEIELSDDIFIKALKVLATNSLEQANNIALTTHLQSFINLWLEQ